jgi:hypothetical protein
LPPHSKSGSSLKPLPERRCLAGCPAGVPPAGTREDGASRLVPRFPAHPSGGAGRRHDSRRDAGAPDTAPAPRLALIDAALASQRPIARIEPIRHVPQRAALTPQSRISRLERCIAGFQRSIPTFQQSIASRKQCGSDSSEPIAEFQPPIASPKQCSSDISEPHRPDSADPACPTASSSDAAEPRFQIRAVHR